MNDELRQQLMDIYRAADAEVAAAGPVCQASGRCCRFTEWGHILYLTALEADVLLESAPAYQTPVTPDACPFQQDKLCTAREPRPLGCRVYFCDPDYQEISHQITEKYLARLRRLATDHDHDQRYAPLHVFLNEKRTGAEPVPVLERRLSLPLAADALIDPRKE